MNSKRIFSLLAFVIATALICWWFAAGHHAWTSAQSLVQVTTKDEIFGTTTTTQKWVDDFTPGFLPLFQMGSFSMTGLIGFFGLGPIAFVFLVIGVWLWIASRKKARQYASS